MYLLTKILSYDRMSLEWDIPSPVIVSTLAVLDLNGFGLAHCSSKMLELIKGTVSIDNVVYPEMLGKMIVINAPWLAGTTPTRVASKYY